MSKFDVLTKYIPMIRTDSIGEWAIDEENNGTKEHTIQMPFVAYSEIVNRFIDDVYAFEKNNKDMEFAGYGDTLKDNGLEWDMKSMKNAEVSDLNAQCVLALIMGAVRAERFCNGALLDFFKSGCILKWLERLNNIDLGGWTMDISKMKALSYDELRGLYRSFLNDQNISKETIKTTYTDTFYIWRKGGRELFWNVVSSKDFANEAKEVLRKTLSENSTGNVNSLVNDYMYHLRKFRLFLDSDGTAELAVPKKENNAKRAYTSKKKRDIDVPKPSIEQVEFYLAKWDGLENYHLQENALNKLFFELCSSNTDVTDILLKASTLNDFYSTNIFSIYPVAKHICSLNIDSRLKSGDVNLVSDIQHVTISDTEKNFYSFASKYCSHHNPLAYPIYDSYVDEMLRYFRNRDGFSDFQDVDLKDYVRFKGILIDFRAFYGLDKYNLKQIDQYVWQLGKDYFPKNYGKKKQGD